ncbi:UPF0561 protein C2orf68 homolog isoform X1 [Pipra filicauda]|uniref:UPF0561 protein C2orf68 homolog isoform X1 n=1 Tax=Pipra filicauda TaxID=649802 RepID=A0A7R5KLM8_9PASS|nr:UPF0561 protein C2orf68 homolog isoform X1 [Pipra filicauda]XP_039242326.1 UPF0561 protein C2orf68 homolog isoform X1 [Pipra filicauda]
MEAAAPAPGWRCRPGGRLDMSHGFVRHIRRNQLARDAYDRAVRQARGRARTRLTPNPPRPRRPDQQVYRPRGCGGPGGDASAGPPPGDPRGAPPDPSRGPRLFCLEYEGDDGTITAVIVHQQCRAPPGGQRGGGDAPGVRPQPPGAPPAQGPVPARAGRAQQAPGHRLTLPPPPGDTGTPPGRCHPPRDRCHPRRCQ